MNLYLEEDFFAQIQPEFLCENVTMKGEDVYLLPEAVDIPSALLFYNRALLEEVGAEIDPEKVSWEEFRQVCEQVTEMEMASITAWLQAVHRKPYGY